MARIHVSLCKDAEKPVHLWRVSIFPHLRHFPHLPCETGIDRNALGEDPQLGSKRTELVVQATRKLAELRMVVHDPATGALQVTDLGRIAAKYYIRFASIEIFTNEFKPRMSEADVLAMLSQSKEVRMLPFSRTVTRLELEP